MNSDAKATDNATATVPLTSASPLSHCHSSGWNTNPVCTPWISM